MISIRHIFLLAYKKNHNINIFTNFPRYNSATRWLGLLRRHFWSDQSKVWSLHRRKKHWKPNLWSHSQTSRITGCPLFVGTKNLHQCILKKMLPQFIFLWRLKLELLSLSHTLTKKNGNNVFWAKHHTALTR